MVHAVETTYITILTFFSFERRLGKTFNIPSPNVTPCTKTKLRPKELTNVHITVLYRYSGIEQ